MSIRATDIKWKDKYDKEKVGYYMDEYLGVNLMGLPNYLKKAWDVVGIVSGHGKVRIGKTCKKGTKVLMANGEWKNVEDIKEGDLVISPDIKTGKHSTAKVIETHSRLAETYDVCNKNTDEILYTCADNHDIPVEYVETKSVPGHRGKGEKRQFTFKRIYTKMEAKDIASKSLIWLRNKGLVTYQGFLINKFDNVANATIEPYSLGVFLGDGNFSKKRHTLQITCSSEEAMLEISNYYPIMSITKCLSNKCKRYNFSMNSKFSDELLKYKYDDKKAGTKFIPEECKRSDAEYRLRLLAGLIDTDGYINKQGMITYTTKSLTLAKDIQEVCRSLGGNTNIKQITKTIKKANFTGTYYNIQINLGKLTNKIPLKRDFKIDRKKGQAQEKNKVGIVVKKSKSQMVYGFELDSESHLYITDNFCITHNSTLAQQIGYFVAWLLAGGKMNSRVDPDGIKRWYVERSPTKPVRFSLEENIVFSPEDLMKTATTLREKYGRNQVIIYDEGRAGLDSARAMQAINKAMQDFFQECGQHGHIILIVLPDFFKLHEDYATVRSLFLVDVFADKQLRRGWFNFYNEVQKEKLYIYGKKVLGLYNRYSQASPSFIGRFTSFMPIDDEAYDRAKHRALKKKQYLRSEKRWKHQRDAALYILKRETEMSCEEIATELTTVCGSEVTKEGVANGIKAVTHEKNVDEIF